MHFIYNNLFCIGAGRSSSGRAIDNTSANTSAKSDKPYHHHDLEERLLAVFQQSDTNKDGVISYDEFLRVMTGFEFYTQIHEGGFHDYYDHELDDHHRHDHEDETDNDPANDTCGKQ